MDRRSVLKQLALLGGGILLAPSCSFDSERLSVALDNLDITPDQERSLADVVETMIPATDSPGGKELKLHEFVLIMVDDCRSEEDQQLFVTGLQDLDPFFKEEFGSSFSESTALQKEDLMAKVLEEKESPNADFPAVEPFLSMTKRYSIRGFLTSQYVMTEELPYKLVPGSFDGCVKLS
ncbi:gluconate 2-dehydrogenase subunit 3 family protein [Fodinibius salsisoli]|uniref:Gluconate 2-dehydrogenase subunit 3 family protein n=1 Tax=Fodinibius salsisoli TaxID=2820877 RepID=A0ABT3PL57_9BACT|nr:gluconate 2-dehydrogenase subunit 3 family protein [Fodinibius salsisoli]MCW9706600.1 gluconate 2-dehydrogenase subunit 3 family protein [Fodinibius salsisoli]